MYRVNCDTLWSFPFEERLLTWSLGWLCHSIQLLKWMDSVEQHYRKLYFEIIVLCGWIQIIASKLTRIHSDIFNSLNNIYFSIQNNNLFRSSLPFSTVHPSLSVLIYSSIKFYKINSKVITIILHKTLFSSFPISLHASIIGSVFFFSKGTSSFRETCYQDTKIKKQSEIIIVKMKFCCALINYLPTKKGWGIPS